jgi:hypothetical protein
MTFSDEDLKRLKEEVSLGDVSHTSPNELASLLARLEAAEVCAKLLDLKGSDEFTFADEDAVRAWRKAAGL